MPKKYFNQEKTISGTFGSEGVWGGFVDTLQKGVKKGGPFFLGGKRPGKAGSNARSS